MKKLYFSLSILFAASQISIAQLSITKAVNEPIVGDSYTQQKYDSLSAIPKNTGAGTSWNFNTCFTANTATESVTYTTVAASPSPAAFPQANLASQRGSSNWDFWKTSASMIEFAGQQDVSNSDIVVFSNLLTWNLWPTTYGTNNSDAMSGTETQGTVTSTWSGNLSYTATGTGTVTLPGGNVHTNCLQLKKYITLSITTGTTVTNMTIQQYEYWSSLSKFPIMTTEYQTQTTGTVVVKKTDTWINTAALMAGVNEHQLTESNFIVYPNPGHNNINVVLPHNQNATSIEIVDINGKIVASNINSNSINVSSLAKAVYTIRVKNKGTVFQKSLVIAE